MDLGTSDCSSACSRQSRRASIRTLDGSDTTRWRAPVFRPVESILSEIWYPGSAKMTDLLASLYVFNHVLVGLVRRIDTRFGALNGQCKRVHHDNRVSHYFPLHHTHDFVRNSGTCMNDLILELYVNTTSEELQQDRQDRPS